jgi:hypothetical protein
VLPLQLGVMSPLLHGASHLLNRSLKYHRSRSYSHSHRYTVRRRSNKLCKGRDLRLLLVLHGQILFQEDHR